MKNATGWTDRQLAKRGVKSVGGFESDTAAAPVQVAAPTKPETAMKKTLTEKFPNDPRRAAVNTKIADCYEDVFQAVHERLVEPGSNPPLTAAELRDLIQALSTACEIRERIEG